MVHHASLKTLFIIIEMIEVSKKHPRAVKHEDEVIQEEIFYSSVIALA